VPGTAAGVVLAFSDTEGSATGHLLPTGRVLEEVAGVNATLVDNGMPVALALASAFDCTGDERPEALAADEKLAARIDAFRIEAGRLMGLGDVSRSSVPKTVLLAPATDGGQVRTLSFIPVRPHSSIGVLAAVSTVTGMLLAGSVGHSLAAAWPAGLTPVDVEHPSGHLLVDVSVDGSVDPPRVIRSGVFRTARKLFDGKAFPR
jgi:4-oxalomesaconate tautomerase